MLKITLLLAFLLTPFLYAFTQEQIDAEKNYHVAIQAKTAKEYSKAFNLFSTLAQQDYGKAQYNLAIMYELGQGTKRDHDKSIYWLEKAAKLYDLNALTLLGELYYNGNGVAQDKEKAAKLIGLAKERQHPKAVYLWKAYNLDQY